MATQRDLRQVVITVRPTDVEVFAALTYTDDQGFSGRQERRIAAPTIVADAEALVQAIITAAQNALGVTLGRG